MKKHLSFANVMSCVALFMALSGVAYAATIGKNAVKAKNIAKGAVTTPKLKNAAVTSGKLANGSVISGKIASDAVASGNLASGSVVAAKLGSGAVTESKLANNAVSINKLATGSVATGKLGKEAVTGEKVSASLLSQLVKNVAYPTPVTSSVDAATAEKSATAECPAGKEAIGGGARVVGIDVPGNLVTGVALTQSAPSANASGKTTSWFALAREIAPEDKEWGVQAHVICAEL